MKHLLFAARSIGHSSEVWLKRQVTGITRLRTSCLCWELKDQPIISGRPIHLIQHPVRPFDGPDRWSHRLRTLSKRNTYAITGAEERDVESLLARENPSVVLAQFGYMGLKLISLLQRRHTPCVVHFHGADLTVALHNRWYRWSLRQQLKSFAAIVVVAEYQREALLSLGADPQSIHTIPCGVPVNSFEPTPKVSVQPCRFLAVGRLVDKKAPLQMLEAFARALPSMPGATLTIIGDGPLRPALEAEITRQQLEAAVDITGFLPETDVKRAMGASGCFLQHSVKAPDGDMEGWPVAIAEAMASGLPVIATRHAGITEQVVDGETGLTHAEHDVATMASQMVQLGNNPELRTKMGTAGRRRIVEVGNFKDSIERLEALLLSVSSGVH